MTISTRNHRHGHRHILVASILAVTTAIVACRGGGDIGDDGSTSSSGSTTSSSGSTSSSSGGSSSGASSSGSSGTSSGFITDGGPGNCGKVTFQLTTNGGGAFCTGSTSCDATWLFVEKADKTALAIESSCTAACGACEAVGCTGNCPAPSPVPLGGATRVWDGRIFTSLKCQSKTSGLISCDEPSCAPPGNYIAKMCAFRAGDAGVGGGCGGAGGSPQQICTEVPFNFPTTNGVTGTIGP